MLPPRSYVQGEPEMRFVVASIVTEFVGQVRDSDAVIKQLGGTPRV